MGDDKDVLVTTDNVTDVSSGTTDDVVDDVSVVTDEPSSDDSTVKWSDSLNEELRGNDRLKGFESVEDLAKAYIASPEPVQLPKPEEYNFPENFQSKELGEWANKAGMSQDQVNQMFDLHSNISAQIAEAEITKAESDLSELLDSWGDKKETNISLARRALNQFDDDGKLAKLLTTPDVYGRKYANNAEVVSFLHKLGHVLNEDGFLRSGKRSSRDGLSAADRIFDGT